MAKKKYSQLLRELKRLQESDNNNQSFRVSIVKSDLSNNWLIVIDGKHCFDSASRLEDAKKVKQWLARKLETHPLKKNADTDTFSQWGEKNHHDSPIVSAEPITEQAEIINSLRAMGFNNKINFS